MHKDGLGCIAEPAARCQQHSLPAAAESGTAYRWLSLTAAHLASVGGHQCMGHCVRDRNMLAGNQSALALLRARQSS